MKKEFTIWIHGVNWNIVGSCVNNHRIAEAQYTDTSNHLKRTYIRMTRVFNNGNEGITVQNSDKNGESNDGQAKMNDMEMTKKVKILKQGGFNR